MHIQYTIDLESHHVRPRFNMSLLRGLALAVCSNFAKTVLQLLAANHISEQIGATYFNARECLHTRAHTHKITRAASCY